MFGHWLEASLYFEPNSCQFVYVEPSPLKDSCIFTPSTLLPLPPPPLPPPPPHCHCRPHKILPIKQGHPHVNMFGNLQQQGDKHNSFDFFSRFQDDTELGHVIDVLDPNFGADFTNGDAFDFDSISFGSFKYGNVSCKFSVERRRRRCQKNQQTNRVFRLKNINKSCWYRYFMRPRLTQEIRHELSNSKLWGISTLVLHAPHEG